MAAAPETHENELSIPERLNDFIQKNRKLLFSGLIALIVILAALITFSTMRDKLQEKALSQVDEFSRRYEKVKITDLSEDPDLVPKLLEIASITDELTAFAEKTFGFAAARSYNLIADMNWDQKNWAEAEKAWSKAAKIAAKTYLAPVSLYNAAVAAEEQGNIEEAIAYYTSVLSYGNAFPSAPRAQFSVGRLEESRNNIQAALDAYRNVLSTWPNDPVWPNIAQSRILTLSE